MNTILPKLPNTIKLHEIYRDVKVEKEFVEFTDLPQIRSLIKANEVLDLNDPHHRLVQYCGVITQLMRVLTHSINNSLSDKSNDAALYNATRYYWAFIHKNYPEAADEVLEWFLNGTLPEGFDAIEQNFILQGAFVLTEEPNTAISSVIIALLAPMIDDELFQLKMLPILCVYDGARRLVHTALAYNTVTRTRSIHSN